MTERMLNELDTLTARIDHLMKSAEGLAKIGRDNSAVLDEAELLVRRWQELAEELSGPDGKIHWFQPKHGRF